MDKLELCARQRVAYWLYAEARAMVEHAGAWPVRGRKRGPLSDLRDAVARQNHAAAKSRIIRRKLGVE